MSDEFMDYVAPVSGSGAIDGLEGQGGGAPQRPRNAQSIPGRIVTVRKGVRPGDGRHALDVTVGADQYTEIVLRVPTRAYGQLEGKRGVLYIDE